MKTKHTPGPWKVWQQPTNTAYYEVSTNWTPQPSVGQTPIASCDRKENTQAHANATLIAAAPELLEACKVILGSLTVPPGEPPQQCLIYSDALSPTSDDQTIVDWLREIVTKAEGGEQ